MELEFDVKMTAFGLYDYLLYHTYTGLSGLIGTLVGVFLIIGFASTKYPIYLIAGVVIILYLPVNLFLRANQQIQKNEAFKKPFHYKMTDEGVSVSQGESMESISWENCYKAVSTRSSIILYTSKVTASIFPRKDIGEKQEALIEMISTHMEPKKVKIRY